MAPRTRPIGPYHHVGGVYLTSRHARLDAPTLRVWVQAPDLMPWPRRGPLWRETVVHVPGRVPRGRLGTRPAPARPSLLTRLRATWRALVTDPKDLLP